ncbi:hypothetical protein IWW55_004219 [Coemansia sp. RSA 2706]|nr:hypothetical protein LPJ63_003881 [Coemansia sp. RSA 2711]KAJ2299311.1 hypothetical protein IWW55_004219 [Coemansia sp. RSA 2706]KAJ2303699.1 hypothetical protein IWW52_006739 [Coemansia sp. RSA 2704]KAJ2312822.1 hypothetical protein IWW54_001870 [Coemansia sp. RSA 2705]KAJ2710091.1 hypothetical protein H4R23_006657 [Coemansia sp. Cherry 401B]
MGVFDIRSEFASYGEYHANRINVAIHMVFVPTILWTSMGLTTLLSPAPLFAYPEWAAALLSQLPGPALIANASTAIMLAFAAFYIVLDQIAGLLALPVIYTFLVTSQQYALTASNSLHVLLFIFAFAWIAQFIGHGVFEKRAPALLDNLLQAFVMAPFFVFLELLFALGYRPGLHRELRNEIGSRILAFRRSHNKNPVKSN